MSILSLETKNIGARIMGYLISRVFVSQVEIIKELLMKIL
jgi:hypothetical protein